jgi:hypothetical protein
MSEAGISALIQVAAFAEARLEMECLGIGGSPDEVVDCLAELAGKSLLYRIALKEGRILLSVQLLDCAADPELLLDIDDSASGWQVVLAVVRSLEEEHVRSLERPIEFGSGANSWVIS